MSFKLQNPQTCACLKQKSQVSSKHQVAWDALQSTFVHKNVASIRPRVSSDVQSVEEFGVATDLLEKKKTLYYSKCWLGTMSFCLKTLSSPNSQAIHLAVRQQPNLATSCSLVTKPHPFSMLKFLMVALCISSAGRSFAFLCVQNNELAL